MLSQQEILDLQAECFADDIPIPPGAASWGEERLRAYFESGGAEESVCGDLDSARSSIDAATVRADPGDGDDDGAAVDEPAELEAGGDERLEPAALDVPMASVPVTPPPPAPSQPPAAPAPPPSRALRKVEEVKALGDAAFRARDFAKAERHYTSALQRAADCAPPPPPTLLASLHSNRAGTLAQLLRHEEALDDARAALRLRPSWARAHSRVGAALLSLRRWDEARAAYDAGLQVDPGSDELRRGHAEAMRAIGTSAGGSAAAAAAKARGNDAFGAAEFTRAVQLYTDAIAAAPADASLYSNRSAAHAKLGRWREALDDGKRAVSLAPNWGKAYSRCGVAALELNDEESSYWFYAFGLKRDPAGGDQALELRRGRDAALKAMMGANTARMKRRRERCRRDAGRPPARVFAVSDVHYDHAGAKEWAARLSTTEYRNDAIIVAGDVGDTFVAVRYCLKAFRAVFRRVFFVPGNHDLWIRPKGVHSDEPSQFADSVHKLIALWQMCDDLDVDTGPAQLGPGVGVLPLDSWHSYLFDHHDPRPGTVLFDSWCKWPMGPDEAWRFMVALNEPRIELAADELKGDLISFSHFLPRQELPLPSLHQIAKGAGTVAIDEQLRRAGAKLHIFGHTHLNTVDEIKGVRYMQNAMGYGIAPGTKLTVVWDGRFKEYAA